MGDLSPKSGTEPRNGKRKQKRGKEPRTGEGSEKRGRGWICPNLRFFPNFPSPPQGSDSDSEGEGPGGEGRLLGPQDPALAQARRVRSLLAALSRSAAELEQLQERALGTPLPPPALAPAAEEAPNSIGARLRRTQHGLLAQQFWGLTGTLQAAQGRYRQRSLQRIQRQLQIAGRAPPSEEELEAMLESGQSQIFVSHAPSPLSSRALDEAGQRHRELQRLERGLRQLGELFQLLSGTVEAQGDVIDRIEQQVLHSGAHLEKGRGHLQGAGRRQKAARKKRLALAACASVAILVLVAIVAASVASG
ncbi:syntaxin-4-like isoform X3 [Zonotrichia leucophrys gambelii]|uniref:syntaxin-4-like isoform X3 n=1 Tax=Zonotrichia leucophrys gambelii TaxID=257770 RepID=UPI00314002BB